MSLTIIQKPTSGLVHNEYEANAPIIYSVKESNLSTMFQHKYVCKIFIGTQANPTTYATPIEMRVKANKEGVGIFDIGSICASFVSPQFTPHGNSSKIRADKPFNSDFRFSIHEIMQYSLNTNGMRYVQVQFFNFFTTSIGTPPSLDPTFAQPQNPIHIINAHRKISDNMLVHDYTTSIGSGVALALNGTGVTDASVLSDCPTTQKIGIDEYHTFSLFNGRNTDLFGMLPGVLHTKGVKGHSFEFFDENGSILEIDPVGNPGVTNTGVYLNSISNGGYGEGVGSVRDSHDELIYVGVGSANIKNLGALPTGSFPVGTAYYEVIFTLRTDITSPLVFKRYRFELLDNCRPYDFVRLCWINRYGAWDYYTFTMRNTQTVNTSKKFYRPISGGWDSANGLEYLPQHGGEQVFNVEQTETLKLETDYLTQDEALFLEQLFVSPFVGIIRNNGGASADGTRFNRFEMVKLTTNTYERMKQKI